jgi:hypothetical protein
VLENGRVSLEGTHESPKNNDRIRRACLDTQRATDEEPEIAMLQRRLLTALLVFVSFTAADIGAQPARATVLTSVSPAHCLDALGRREAPDLLRCPTALRTAIIEAAATCRDAGGKLEGADEGNVWALDVDDDGRNELAFELNANVSCVDAWSIFSCGSSGCPKTLYALRDGEWSAVGSVHATSPELVSLGARGADAHRSLDVCSDERCAVRSIYEWVGASYEVTRIDVRGVRVDVAGSINGLYPLTVAVTLRAAPDSSATDAGRYEAGTEVAIVGTVEGGGYYYVSPCNACASGFVPRSAVAVP